MKHESALVTVNPIAVAHKLSQKPYTTCNMYEA